MTYEGLIFEECHLSSPFFLLTIKLPSIKHVKATARGHHYPNSLLFVRYVSYHKEKSEDIKESFWEAINRMTDRQYNHQKKD